MSRSVQNGALQAGVIGDAVGRNRTNCWKYQWFDQPLSFQRRPHALIDEAGGVFQENHMLADVKMIAMRRRDGHGNLAICVIGYTVIGFAIGLQNSKRFQLQLIQAQRISFRRHFNALFHSQVTQI